MARPNKRKEHGRKEGTWRKTVPMARLRCQDTEEGHFGHKEFREEEDYMDSGGWKCGGTAPIARPAALTGYRWRRKGRDGQRFSVELQ